MWRFRIFLLIFLLSSQPFFGLKAEETQPTPATETVRKKRIEKLEIGDRLLVKIFPEDQYIKGGEMVVSSEGDITLPLIGKVRVEGKQIVEAEREILGLLAQDYLVNPVVVIEVTKEIRKDEKALSVLGQVQKPGTYQIPELGKLTLLQLISMAGGFTDVANVKKIKIIRKEKGKVSIIRANAEAIIAGNQPDIELAEGDLIHVGESLF